MDKLTKRECQNLKSSAKRVFLDDLPEVHLNGAWYKLILRMCNELIEYKEKSNENKEGR